MGRTQGSLSWEGVADLLGVDESRVLGNIFLVFFPPHNLVLFLSCSLQSNGCFSLRTLTLRPTQAQPISAEVSRREKAGSSPALCPYHLGNVISKACPSHGKRRLNFPTDCCVLRRSLPPSPPPPPKPRASFISVEEAMPSELCRGPLLEHRKAFSFHTASSLPHSAKQPLK